MAEKARVDAYGDDEQALGFHAMIVDNLKVPFVTSVLCVDVTVEHIGLAEDNSILAMCTHGGIRQADGVLDLPQFIEDLYLKRFGRERSQVVTSAGKWARPTAARKATRNVAAAGGCGEKRVPGGCHDRS